MRLALFRTFAFVVAAAAASTAAAQHPRLLKRHGIVYGVRGVQDRNCKGFSPLDSCTTYTVSGTIVSVDRHAGTGRIDNFVVRTANGRTQVQNFIDYMPPPAERLIRCGRHVHASGTRTGVGQVAFPDTIVTSGGAGYSC
jgi:hypothetical protein